MVLIETLVNMDIGKKDKSIKPAISCQLPLLFDYAEVFEIDKNKQPKVEFDGK